VLLLSSVFSVARQVRERCSPGPVLVGCEDMECAALVALAVKGRPSVCGGCKCVWYCSPKCQAAHWGVHKHVCGRLRRALAARHDHSTQVGAEGANT
jgi:hypothetical protein